MLRSLKQNFYRISDETFLSLTCTTYAVHFVLLDFIPLNMSVRSENCEASHSVASIPSHICMRNRRGTARFASQDVFLMTSWRRRDCLAARFIY
jgi:hypothetical protein